MKAISLPGWVVFAFLQRNSKEMQPDNTLNETKPYDVQMRMGYDMHEPDERLVIRSVISGRILMVFTPLFFAAIILGFLYSFVITKLSEPGLDGAFIPLMALGLLPVAILVWFRKPLWATVRNAARGETLVFNRGRDVLMRNGQGVAALSSIKTVRVENPHFRISHVNAGLPNLIEYDPACSLLDQNNNILLRVFTDTKSSSGDLARAIAEYAGAELTEAT